ncbi:hypothetical protein DAPK24_036410 [Pichia kluyveri]|uniref:Uncharacterized protein n=1 Tax=Pichia kluyveri TaxID=36015 RepID=A0AAV5R900_PICKL|nr:hypothetical protein DAPK24_036410 [Pichia kluyveri]
MLNYYSKPILRHSAEYYTRFELQRFNDNLRRYYSESNSPDSFGRFNRSDVYKTTHTQHEKGTFDFPFKPIPASYKPSIIHFLNNIKRKYSLIENNETTDDFINYLKCAINNNNPENSSCYDFYFTLQSITPLLSDSLMKIDNNEKFIDLFRFLSSAGIRFESDDVIEKFLEIYKKSDPQLQLALIRCNNNISPEELRFSDKLTSDEISNLTYSYSSKLLKNIITEILIPLQSNEKILEFLNVLSLHSKKTCKDHSLFNNLIYLTQLNRISDLEFKGRFSILFVLNAISNYIKSGEYIPVSLKNSFHEYILRCQLQEVDIETMLSYIEFFYPSDLRTLIPKLNDFELKLIPDNLSSEVSSYKIESISNKLPLNIASILFDQLIKQNDMPLIRDLFRDLNNLDSSIEYNKKLLETFKSSAFKYAVNVEHEHKEVQETLFETIRLNDAYFVPKFDKFDLSSVINTHNSDVIEINKFFNTYRTKIKDYEMITEEDVSKLFEIVQPSSIYHEMLMRSLLSCNFTFENTEFIKNWMDEDPSRCDFVLTGGNDDLKTKDIFFKYHATKVSILKGLLLFKPNEIFQMIHKHGDNITYKNELLSVLSTFRDYGMDYLIAQLVSQELESHTTIGFFEFLKDFFRQNNLLIELISDDDKLKIYNVYIKKVMGIHFSNGVILAASLIPAYQKIFLALTGLHDSFIVDCGEFASKSDKLDLPIDIIKSYVEFFSDFRSMKGGIWFGIYARLTNAIKEFECHEIQKNELIIYLFQKFQKTAIKNYYNWGITPIYEIYSIAENNKGLLRYKVRFDGNAEFNRYIAERFSIAKISNKPEKKISKEIMQLFATVSRYETNFIISKENLLHIFNLIDDKDKEYFIYQLKRLSKHIPYVENVSSIINNTYKLDREKNRRLLTMYAEELDNEYSQSRQRRIFDARYFIPFYQYAMKNNFKKHYRESLRNMIVESNAVIEDFEEIEDCRKFSDIYDACAFRKLCEEDEVQNDLVMFQRFNDEVLMKDRNGKLIIPLPIYDDFVYYYLFNKTNELRFKSYARFLYYLTKKDEKLAKLGFWDILKTNKNNDHIEDEFAGEINDIIDFNELPKLYEEMSNEKIARLFGLYYFSINYTEKITTNELTTLITMTENILSLENLDKDIQSRLLYHSFNIIAKHSDLLSAFYKKVKNFIHFYTPPVNLADEILFSIVKNDIKDIDSVINLICAKFDSPKVEKIFEKAILKLMNDGLNGLAEELYLKCIERKPKFRIQELNDSLNWGGKAKSPTVRIDSNNAVNMKMDKFQVKLYDYANLDKDKK